MSKYKENVPDPKEIERELGEFLAKKFGGDVKIVSPMAMPDELLFEKGSGPSKKQIDFDLKPEELISYLDQYIVKQDVAKAVIATKICTHFNRIARSDQLSDDIGSQVGGIKNNVLMIGPTGVGKTYMIKLIAKRIGVPFVKGDATKFSETGYVGGDVEDLVRDLVREADSDIDLAQNGIIYLDEVDKIASNRHLIGADVSRTGVQRALLKPMEETEVEMKVPHDPISMIQEIEKFRKTGKRERRTVNTKNILFIMSGAFSDLGAIIQKRIAQKRIGFGSDVVSSGENPAILRHVRSEDLIEFGFESEFIGRLPVHAVFERLTEEDLYEILKNPNNPVILGKKLDFSAYGISAKFDDNVLKAVAKKAFEENTGARGLVSAIERTLLPFEKKLPSTGLRVFPVTSDVVDHPEKTLEKLKSEPNSDALAADFEKMAENELAFIRDYVNANKGTFADKYGLTLTPSRIDKVASYYCEHILDIGSAVSRIKHYTDEIKKIELYFYKNHDTNIVIEEDAIDAIFERLMENQGDLDAIYDRLTSDFKLGLKLVREKTGKTRFFITKEALENPEQYISSLFQEESESAETAEQA